MIQLNNCFLKFMQLLHVFTKILNLIDQKVLMFLIYQTNKQRLIKQKVINIIKMSKINPQTIISDRLLEMKEQTLSIKRQKNNLYSHLCELLVHLPLSNDSKNRKLDSIKQLAAISEYVKTCTNREKEAQPLTQENLNELVSKRTQYPLWFKKKRQLLAYNEKNQESAGKKQSQVQNFQKSQKTLFSPAGLGFGPEQALRIHIAIKKLRQKVNGAKMRFWGKILTRKSDYYIIQGVMNKKNEDKVRQGMQKYSEGANLYSYWANTLTMQNEWYELPLITSNQLKTSRLIKYTFTGDLHSQIKAYPKFQGKEEHLLKCQLVRITHNCEIAPKGMYGPTQQNPDEIQYTEDFKIPQFSELSNVENWVHLNPYLLELGRCTYWTDPKLTEEQRDELINKLSETDPRQERLKQINQDKPPSDPRGIETAWFIRQIGSTQVYNNVGKDEGTTSCYGLVTIKNINWPGWMTVGGMGMFDSIYIGYGWKATQAAFWPVGCEDLQIQGQDAGQNDEPNPRNPPDELEPDSDDQNKKAEQQ